jgi:hypothetical protein
VKYLVFKSVLHKEEAEISDMYVLCSTSGETGFGKSDYNCTIMKKLQLKEPDFYHSRIFQLVPR